MYHPCTVIQVMDYPKKGLVLVYKCIIVVFCCYNFLRHLCSLV